MLVEDELYIRSILEDMQTCMNIYFLVEVFCPLNTYFLCFPLSKQLEQEQNRSNGDHVEGHQHGGGWRRMGEKVQGIRSINGR